jgi:predicted DCC family thiol-disulfide oxidoreductase YuxK
MVVMDGMSEITVCYNGACPVCRAEIEHYRRCAPSDARLTLLDVAADPVAAARLGLAGDRPFRRLHAIDAQGRIVGGVAAFAQVWRRLPGYRFLARLVDKPLARNLAAFAYERVAAPLLFYLHQRRQRRTGSGRG